MDLRGVFGGFGWPGQSLRCPVPRPGLRKASAPATHRMSLDAPVGIVNPSGSRRIGDVMKGNKPVPTPGKRSAARIGFVLLGLAWVVWLLGLARRAWINSRFTGPADDVVDSLGRAGYVSERLLVFDIVTVATDVVAWCVLMASRETTGWQVLALVLLFPSTLLHGIVLLIHLIVAG